MASSAASARRRRRSRRARRHARVPCRGRRRRPAGSRAAESSTSPVVFEVERGVDGRHVMPQTGSIAIRRRAGVGSVASARGGGRRAARRRPRPRGDDLGQDRQRDLAGRAGADVEPGRRVDPAAGRRPSVERGEHGRAALAAGDQPDVRDLGAHRRRRAPPPRRGRARRRPRAERVRRRTGAGSRREAHLVAEPAAPTATQRPRDRRVAVDHAPAAAGMTGSRKISSVPPDRHGLCDRRAMPVAADAGRRRRGRDPQQQSTRPTSSSRRLCTRTVDSAQEPPTKPSIVPSGSTMRLRRRAWREVGRSARTTGRGRTAPCAAARSSVGAARQLDRRASSHWIARSGPDRAALHRPPHLGRASAACRRGGRRTA